MTQIINSQLKKFDEQAAGFYKLSARYLHNLVNLYGKEVYKSELSTLLEESDNIFPKGHRVLEKTGISEKDIGILIKNFKNLNSILYAKKEDLITIFGEEKTNEILEKVNHTKG